MTDLDRTRNENSLLTAWAIGEAIGPQPIVEVLDRIDVTDQCDMEYGRETSERCDGHAQYVCADCGSKLCRECAQFYNDEPYCPGCKP